MEGLLVRVASGAPIETLQKVGGCYIDVSKVSEGQVYALEAMSCITLLTLAVGLGLDPREQEVFGPALALIQVAMSTGIIGFASGVALEGYSGSCKSLTFFWKSHVYVVVVLF